MSDSIRCKNCGKQLARRLEDSGIIHFDLRLPHGRRFELMASPNDNSKSKCPHCGKWSGIWEMTPSVDGIEFIGRPQ